MLSARLLRFSALRFRGGASSAPALGCEAPPPVVPRRPCRAAAPSAIPAPAAAGPALASVDEAALDQSVLRLHRLLPVRLRLAGSSRRRSPRTKPSWTRSFDVHPGAQRERAPRDPRALRRRAGEDEPNAKKLGDFYAALHGRGGDREGRARRAQAALDAIERIKTAKDSSPVLAALHGRGVSAGLRVRLGAGLQGRDPGDRAASSQAGLGLPDRDYYLKDDAATMQSGAGYAEHVANMLELLGEKPEAAQAARADRCSSFETRWPRSRSRARGAARSAEDLPPHRARRPGEGRAGFPLERLLHRARRRPRRGDQRGAAGLHQGLRRAPPRRRAVRRRGAERRRGQGGGRPSRGYQAEGGQGRARGGPGLRRAREEVPRGRVEDLPALAHDPRGGELALVAVRRRDFRFERSAHGRREAAAALEALRATRPTTALGEALGAALRRRRRFGAEGKARTQADGAEHRAAR